MKRTVIIVLSVMLACLFFCACRQEPESPADKIVFYSEINVQLKSGKREILNIYETDFFRKDACVFDKSLALLSYALAAANSEDNAVDTFNKMGFDNLKQHWNGDSDIDGCSYVIGHRKVDDSELVAVYIKGIGYNVEWAGNMMMGGSGNHYGFETAAAEVYTALKDYLAANYPGKSPKLWITGYSRGGAITDALAYNILTQKEINIEQKDLFVYAFEPPASVSSDAISEEYPCIHNFFVEADLVASIPPAIPSVDYGLSHPGVDVKMASSVDRVSECLHKYVDSGINMPEFTSADDYADPAEFLTYFIKGATSAAEDESAASLESRAKYYSTIQGRLTYLVEVLMKNNRAGLGALIQYISDNKDQLMSLFLRWIAADGFYNDLCPLLDSCGTEYVATDLETACSILPSLYLNANLDVFLLGFVSDEGKINNVKYIISCHYPEVCYALLKGYQEN